MAVQVPFVENAPPVQPAAPNPLGQLGAGAAAAGNSLLFGAPEFVTNLIGGEDAYRKFIDANNAPVMGMKPEDIGNIAGLAGSLFIPGGAIAKALGAGAKGLGAAKVGQGLTKAGEFLGGAGKKGIVAGAQRGAGQALEQALPRAAFETADETINQGQDLPTSLGQNLSEVGTSAGLGAGIGGTLGSIGSMARKIFGDKAQIEASKAASMGEQTVPGKYGTIGSQDLVDQIRSGTAKSAAGSLLGVTSRVGRWLANMGPNYEKGPIGQGQAVEKATQNLVNFMAKTGMRNVDDIENYHGELKKTFDDISKSINSKNTDFPTSGVDVVKNGEVQIPAWLKNDDRFQNWFKTIGPEKAGLMSETYLKKVSEELNKIRFATGEDSLPELRNILARDASSLRQVQDPALQQQFILAGHMRDALDLHALKVTPKDKINFPAYTEGTPEGLKKAYKDLALFRLADRMEQTDFNPAFTVNSDTQLKLAMSGIGGIAGANAAGYDPNNPAGSITGAVLGALTGNALSRGASGLASKMVGSNALKLNQALGSAERPSALAGGIEKARDLITGQPGANPMVGSLSKSPALGMGAPAPAGMLAQAPAPEAQGMAIPAGGPQDTAAFSGQPQAQQVLQGLGRYGQALTGKITQLYQQLDRAGGSLSRRGIDINTFANGLMRASNNFDPTIMANILFPDTAMREDFLKSYQQVQQLRGLNIDSVLGTNPIVGGLGGSVLNGQYAATRQQIAQILSQTGKANDVKNAIDQIDKIQWLNVGLDQKRLMLAQLLQRSLGINVGQVHQLGLDEGTILEVLQ